MSALGENPQVRKEGAMTSKVGGKMMCMDRLSYQSHPIPHRLTPSPHMVLAFSSWSFPAHSIHAILAALALVFPQAQLCSYGSNEYYFHALWLCYFKRGAESIYLLGFLGS